MKKLRPFCILFVALLLYSFGSQAAGPNIMFLGSGGATPTPTPTPPACVACPTCRDKQDTASDYDILAEGDSGRYLANTFTAAATYTAHTLYVYGARGSSDITDNLTAYLCADTGGKPTAISSCTAADATVAASTWDSAGWGSSKFTFTTGFSITQGSVYHVVLASDDVTAYYFAWYHAHSVSGSTNWASSTSSAGADWSQSSDGNSQYDFRLTDCVE